ncbi:MAG: type III pantothenate kinase [Candidatus Omnitrophota bacterium]
MLLAIDIGNTNIKLAVFKDKKILHIWRLDSNKQADTQEYTGLLRRSFTREGIKPAAIKEIVICSVVPGLTDILARALDSLLGKKPLVLGKDIIVPLKNLYKKPEQVGQDRLVSAFAAYKKYGAPLILVDFGTALTFDVVSRQGEYLGGVIVPGIEVSLNALMRNAALLPKKIQLTKIGSLLGRDTVSSMQSGIVYGYAALVDGILQRLRKDFKTRPRVIATGGAVQLIAPYCNLIDSIDTNLTLEGILITYENALKQEKKEEKD